MPTSLDTPRTPLPPIVQRTAIGQTFIGALAKVEQRDRMKRTDSGESVPDLKPNGKAKQELVLTLVVMPGTDAPAGLKGEFAVPEPGEVVRMILKGAAFGQWIEAKNAHGALQTGDVVTQVTDSAQTYNGPGNAIGKPLTTQAEVDAVDLKRNTVGIYGTLTLRAPTPQETKWAELADEVHHNLAAAARVATPLEDDETEEPF